MKRLNFFLKIKLFSIKFIKNKQGSNAVEYAIISASIAAIILVIFKSESGNSIYDLLSSVFETIKSKIH
ncbi:Flp family type IVb pilin [Orbus sasakiae]|uniref:Flp family type IVb pilin n=1 Tax=Orbus sasakiae TaxID=1078475 RepID=UPI003CD07875